MDITTVHILAIRVLMRRYINSDDRVLKSILKAAAVNIRHGTPLNCYKCLIDESLDYYPHLQSYEKKYHEYYILVRGTY